jgi:GTP-binding protein
MLNFRNTIFIKSATEKNGRPEKTLPEVLFVGRSNVGKSSLLNALTDNSHLAFTSSKPGHTRLLNYYSVDQKLYFVDAPGYGFAKGSKEGWIDFGKMMEDYFVNNSSLRVVLFLLDGRRQPTVEDIDLYRFFKTTNVPFILIATKSDKLNQSAKAKLTRQWQNCFEDDKLSILPVSIQNRKSISSLAATIERWVK